MVRTVQNFLKKLFNPGFEHHFPPRSNRVEILNQGLSGTLSKQWQLCARIGSASPACLRIMMVGWFQKLLLLLNCFRI